MKEKGNYHAHHFRSNGNSPTIVWDSLMRSISTFIDGNSPIDPLDIHFQIVYYQGSWFGFAVLIYRYY